ncbi:MAG: prepilin-type N-terminal cleavage/methylation domain-containing protein [Rubrivivax sp.]|nr:prepilin-type N-terminal cleavage/methylation domain-containing protein [Rubrivivax sp.]
MKPLTSMDSASRVAPVTGACRGFTLTEVLITMVVLGVLVAVALPTYQSSLRKGRRAEAFNALTSIQQASERHRSLYPTFTSNLTAAPSASIPGLGQPGTRTTGGYYDLAVSVVDATTYVATATAVTGTSQANDGSCSVLAVRMQGGNVRYGAGTIIDWSAANTDPQRCWAR